MHWPAMPPCFGDTRPVNLLMAMTASSSISVKAAFRWEREPVAHALLEEPLPAILRIPVLQARVRLPRRASSTIRERAELRVCVRIDHVHPHVVGRLQIHGGTRFLDRIPVRHVPERR